MQCANDAVDIADLLRQQRDRAGEHPDRVDATVHEVVHVPGHGALAHPLGRGGQFGRRHPVQRLPDPGSQPRAAKTQDLGRPGLEGGRGCLRLGVHGLRRCPQ